jgi:hypothetical protein
MSFVRDQFTGGEGQTGWADRQSLDLSGGRRQMVSAGGASPVYERASAAASPSLKSDREKRSNWMPN